MNYFAPTCADLLREHEEDRIRDKQHDAMEAFRKAVRICLADVQRLEIPLGLDTPHYDMEAVLGLLNELLIPADEQMVKDMAADRAAAAE